MTTLLADIPDVLDLQFVEGDPFSRQWIKVNQITEAAQHDCHFKSDKSAAAVVLLTPTVSALRVTLVYPGGDTNETPTVTPDEGGESTLWTLSFTQEQSRTLPAGKYFHDIQERDGRTLFSGKVKVDKQVTEVIQ